MDQSHVVVRIMRLEMALENFQIMDLAQRTLAGQVG